MRSRIVRRLRKSAPLFALSSLALALIVAIAYRFQLTTAIVVPLFLLVIVVHALADGFFSSGIVSLIAGACLVFFFADPIFDFRIESPIEAVAFLVFLIVSNGLAVLVSRGYRILRNSRKHLALAENAAHLAVWECDVKTRVVTISGEYHKLYGLAPGRRTLTYDEWLSMIHPEDRAQVRAHVRDVVSRTHTWDEEFRVIWPDGSIHWLLGRGTVFQDDAGRPVRIAGVDMDVTDRKYTTEALRQSEERLRLAVQATNDAVWDIDLATGTVSWNDTYATLYGRPPESSRSWQWWIDRIHPEDRERTSSGLASAIKSSESTWTCEYRFKRVDGTWAYLYDRAYIARHPSGDAWRVIGAMQDLTERKRAEAELLESEERFRNIADSAPVIVWVCGADGAITFTNRFGLNFLGRNKDQGPSKEWTDFLHPDDVQRVASEYSSAISDRRVFQLNFRLRRTDGEYRSMLSKGVPRFARDVYSGHIGMTTDITELEQGQEQLREAQKLESLGVLAGGIAHDFNNLLGGILAEAELVETDTAPASLSRDGIQRIKMAALRGSEIVSQLMIYAGEGQKDLTEAVDISRLVEEMLSLLKVSISKQVTLRMDFGVDLPTVRGQASQIRQLMMNLVLNASEAIGETKGEISVTAANVSGGQELAPNNVTALAPGDYVRIEVSDTGCGMTEEIKAKIFDPFFSTKFSGRGLGLAVVNGIVRDLGGAINIASSPGQGSVFQILLPRAIERTADPNSANSFGEWQRSNGQAQTILMVEDEETLRRAVSMGLRKRGFSVIEASDGSVALDLIQAHKDEIDVVVLDVTIPGASSRQVFEEAARIGSNVKVIVTSAFGRERVDAYYTGLQVDHFIRKPFRIDDLMRLCQSALPARAG